MQTATQETRDEDREYAQMLRVLNQHFLTVTDQGKRPLFTTNVSELFNLYLSYIPDAAYSTCNACHHFLRHYGGLVVITDAGETVPAVWGDLDNVPTYYRPALNQLRRAVQKARVTGVFKSELKVWGTPTSPPSEKHGGRVWSHMHIVPPAACVYPTRGVVDNAFQASAKIAENRRTVLRALADYPLEILESAVALLEADALFNGQAVLPGAIWLRDLQKLLGVSSKDQAENLSWLILAGAPDGFCHPKGGMLGTLLDDLVAGKDLPAIQANFKAKMDPLTYRRPTAAPAQGTIQQAEKIFEKLGLASALQRRFARAEECEALWRPSSEPNPVLTGRTSSKSAPAAPGGVFSSLNSKPVAPMPGLPAATMTWTKFQETVLQGARAVEFFTPAVGPYGAILTASDDTAPQLFLWGHPFSHFYYTGGRPEHVGLNAGQWVRVEALCKKPHEWHGARVSSLAPGLFIVLTGARVQQPTELALFPATLRSDLHGVRSVLEAYSKKGQPAGAAEGSACGFSLVKGGSWNVQLRVTTQSGVRTYLIDRWD